MKMRNKRLKKKGPRIDKSKLEYGMDVKIEDVKYRNSYHGAKCLICQTTESTVGAHIRQGYCGIGKPSDDLTLPLCFKHHAKQHEIGEEAFWMEYMGESVEQAKEAARQRYRDYLERMKE